MGLLKMILILTKDKVPQQSFKIDLFGSIP